MEHSGSLADLRIAVLADTHLRHPRRLPETVTSRLGDIDLILHAGDLLDDSVLDELATYAPTHAVLGNNDAGLHLPQARLVDAEGVRIAMIHDSGQEKGRAARLARRFPDADVVVFGHSHAPVNQPGEGGQLLFNPGSPVQRRAQPRHSMGFLVVSEGGRLSDARIEYLDPPTPL